MAIAELDEIGAGDGGQDREAADGQGIEHRARQAFLAGEEDRGQNHRRDDGDGVGLEEIGRHAGAVADIVADIVGDGRRIARIVLGNARLDLADEVGADVGALGEDAAAETREDRDERGAEAQADERVDDRAVGGRVARAPGEDRVIDRDAEQREPRDEQTRDRARLESDVQTFGERLRGGLSGADIGAHRNVHADVAGRAREHRAEHETEGDPKAEKEGQQHRDARADDGDGPVLAIEIGLRALGDRARDLLHFRGACVLREELLGRHCAIGDGRQSKQNGEKQYHGGFALSFRRRVPTPLAATDRRPRAPAEKKTRSRDPRIAAATVVLFPFARKISSRQWQREAAA